jgi:DNA-binding CsgD family transcriptional regulator
MCEFDRAYEAAFERIGAASSADELLDALKVVVAVYGLDHAVYHAVKLPGCEVPHPALVLTYPDEWVDRYIRQDYFRIDPIVAAGATAFLPVDWARVDKRGARAKQVFGEAREFGIGDQGITFPVRGPAGDHALFTVTSTSSDREWEGLKRVYLRDLQALGHLIHAKMVELRCGGGALVPVLSPRERQCLAGAAAGLRDKEIALELKISERVVRAYFETSRHKLHCRNRTQVVARAVALGIVQTLPVLPSPSFSTG